MSDAGACPVGAAYRTSKPVPALFHEDPLFLDLCAAFDELLGPFVVALDCFDAYLDPWLAPADFLGWLGTMVGMRPDSAGLSGERQALTPDLERAWRVHIAGAVRGYQARGTVQGLRAAAAAAAGVPDEQVSLTGGGGVTWTDTAGTAVSPAFDPMVEITVGMPAGSDAAVVTTKVREAVESSLPVFSQLRITVEES